MTPILFTEEAWANSQLSIARYYGGINFDGYRFIIVDKLGRDLYECTHVANLEGREKAIEPGEPADLIRADFQKLYRKYGRDKFIETLNEHPEIEKPDQMAEILKDEPPRSMKELSAKIKKTTENGSWDGVDADLFMDEIRGREPNDKES